MESLFKRYQEIMFAVFLGKSLFVKLISYVPFSSLIKSNWMQLRVFVFNCNNWSHHKYWPEKLHGNIFRSSFDQPSTSLNSLDQTLKHHPNNYNQKHHSLFHLHEFKYLANLHFIWCCSTADKDINKETDFVYLMTVVRSSISIMFGWLDFYEK